MHVILALTEGGIGVVRTTWQLSSDESSVRLSLPGLPVEGARQPVHINIEFDASVVGLIIDRLRMLRAQMKPPPPGAGKLNLRRVITI
jgi:hypothetical protein